jgi:hypothetical protein
MVDSTSSETGVDAAPASHRMSERSMPRWAPPLIIACVGLSLYLPGINWGLPSAESWSQDTIAGRRSIGPMHYWPDRWEGRYPPLQYAVNRLAYEPIYRHWRSQGVLRVHQTMGIEVPVDQQPERYGLLIAVSRWITVVMALGCGWGIFLTGRLLMRDDAVALAGAMVLMIGAAFCYFAHLGNVDVPAMCWFALSAYFYVRTGRGGGSISCGLLGLFAGLAVCTKDGMAGMYPGMAGVLLAIEYRRARSGASGPHAALAALANVKWLVGIACFAVPFLYINGMFHDFQAQWTRINSLADEVRTAHYRAYENQWQLARATVGYAASAVGWPMLAAMLAGVIHGLRRHRAEAAILLVPAACYYVMFIMPVRFVYARFLLPPLALIGILTARAGADFLRWGRLPYSIRALAVSMPVLFSLAQSIAIDRDMIHDTRYDAERWFEASVPRPADVGVFCKLQYLPRLSDKGYDLYPVEMTRGAFDIPQPEYLVLSSYGYIDFDDQQKAVMVDLLAGRLGYELVASFRRTGPLSGGSWLELAGWGVERVGKISPEIIVLRRRR